MGIGIKHGKLGEVEQAVELTKLSMQIDGGCARETKSRV
jgi:hypothetical protein